MVDSRSKGVKLETKAEEEINPSEAIPLVRQSSIFSLTLEELQNSHYWNERNLRSINMDELLKNLRTPEENPGTDSDDSNGDDDGYSSPSVQQQPQQAVPSPLIGKTGQEIWEEIQREEYEEEEEDDEEKDSNGAGESHATPALTLGDFLMRTKVPSGTNRPPSAPVLRVTVAPPLAAPPPPRVAPATEGQQFGLFMNNTTTTAALGPTGFGFTPTLMGIAMGGINIQPKFQPFPFAGVTGEMSNYAGIRVGNGSGAFGVTISPASPLSSDGIRRENSERSGIGDGGAEVGGFGRRKRGIEGGPAADVVGERKQQRMIKNRESAARSRARKQAYTVEIETELKKMREENAQLKQTLLETEKKVKWMETQAELKKTKAQKTQEKLGRLRRCSSVP